MVDERVLSLAVENAFEHIIITDRQGVVIYANKAAEELTGYSKEEIIGAKPSLWGGLMDEDYYKKMWEVISVQKQPFVAEIKNKRKNGEEYDAEVRINPVVDDGGELILFVGIERDISERKRIDKLKTDILSLISHQLKTPIGQLQAYLDNLLSGVVGEFTNEQREYLSNVNFVILRMARMVSNILNVSRIERGVVKVDLNPTDLVKLVERTVGVCQVTANKKSLEFEFEHEPVVVMADELLLEEVVTNLLHNAVKFTDKGSVKVKVFAEGSRGKMIVEDTGPGIDPELLPKLFTREAILSKAPSSKEGNRLGMFVVSSFMKLQNGEINVDSQLNRGSKFEISLALSGNDNNKEQS